jgi:hypothetical protein
LDRLRKEGVVDLTSYLKDHPDTIALCAELVKILDVNRGGFALAYGRNQK